jgi:hypothetical protein
MMVQGLVRMVANGSMTMTQGEAVMTARGRLEWKWEGRREGTGSSRRPLGV